MSLKSYFIFIKDLKENKAGHKKRNQMQAD